MVPAPHDHYEETLRRGHQVTLNYRERFGCFSFLGLCQEHRISDRMTPEILNQLATKLDDTTIADHGFSQMHTRTSKDPGRLRQVDPNQQYPGVSTNQEP